MFYVASKTLDVALSPLTWSLLLAVAAGVAALRRARRPARALVIASFGVLYAASTGFVASNLVLYMQHFDGPRWDPRATYDAVIVLGGFASRGYRDEIELSEAGDRLLRAHDLLASGRAKLAVIVAGGSAPPDNEADLASELLTRWGIAKERILLGHDSRNTRENALEARTIVQRAGLKRLVMVTTAFHMQRAAECMRAVGLTPDLLATDYIGSGVNTFEALAPRAMYLAVTERLLRELAGRVVYRANGYARPR